MVSEFLFPWLDKIFDPFDPFRFWWCQLRRFKRLLWLGCNRAYHFFIWFVLNFCLKLFCSKRKAFLYRGKSLVNTVTIYSKSAPSRQVKELCPKQFFLIRRECLKHPNITLRDNFRRSDKKCMALNRNFLLGSPRVKNPDCFLRSLLNLSTSNNLCTE